MIPFNEKGMKDYLLEDKNILHDKKGGIEILIRGSDSVAESQSYIGGKQGLVLGVIDKREANPFSYILEFSNNPNRGTLNRIEQHGKSPIYFAGMEETFFHDYGNKIKSSIQENNLGEYCRMIVGEINKQEMSRLLRERM